QMQFIAYKDKREYALGRNFSCDIHHYLDEWTIGDKHQYAFKPIEASDVVFVTYASSNHFTEARKGVRSMRAVFENKIIFYDLGLKPEQVKELEAVCNLEVRKLQFKKYPVFVTYLNGYNFKPIIMAEVFSELEHFWIIDASIRFFDLEPSLYDFYANVTSGIMETIVLRRPSFHSIFATTHPKMYEYLPVDIPFAKTLDMLSATMFIARSDFSREAVKWNVLCALTEDCMAPNGGRLPCAFAKDRYNFYANCHRYDQSSMNIIVTSLLERDGWSRRDRVNDDSMSGFSSVERGDVDKNPLVIPC
ncbi:hypothetical protein PFISCL1PPCAC_3685, partial [Pristionchus fissidentatus]